MLLVKFPTRSRPDQFLQTLSEYISKAKDNSRITYLISIDSDDLSITNKVKEKAKSMTENVIICTGESKTKIEACNADIDKIKDWNIVLLVSDDMRVGLINWDEKIISDFNNNFDLCLWYYDGYQRHICTLSCIGREYYDRFGYLYHPSYKSFFCDNEFTEIAQAAGKMKFIGQPIIKHMHPSWGAGVAYDELYTRNDTYWKEDESNYNNRKANGYNH